MKQQLYHFTVIDVGYFNVDMEVSRNKLDQLVSATRSLFDKVQNNDRVAGGLMKQCEFLQQSLRSTQEVSSVSFFDMWVCITAPSFSTKDRYRRLDKVVATGASW